MKFFVIFHTHYAQHGGLRNTCQESFVATVKMLKKDSCKKPVNLNEIENRVFEPGGNFSCVIWESRAFE